VAHARLFYAQKKYHDAALLAQHAIERKPDCEGVWNILGRTYFASGRYEEAAALTQRAIESNGDDYNTYIPYLNTLERLGRKKDAEHVRELMIKVLRQQLELVPEDVRARILLAGNLAYLKQDADETIRQLQTAVALRPGDPNTLYNAACTYGILGKKAEALETIKKAFAVGYSNPGWAGTDSDLDLLHDDPEFQKLVAPSERPAS
jgi:tetratricopeptide (TPR) repeat protein